VLANLAGPSGRLRSNPFGQLRDLSDLAPRNRFDRPRAAKFDARLIRVIRRADALTWARAGTLRGRCRFWKVGPCSANRQFRWICGVRNVA
jgi:hypothetical protein